MDKTVVYGFLAGLHMGRFTGFISNCILTGIVVFIYDPQFYSKETFNTAVSELVKYLR